MRVIAQVGARVAARTAEATARRPGRATARAARSPRPGGDVGQAEIEALAGERMNDMGGVADEDPAARTRRGTPRTSGHDAARTPARAADIGAGGLAEGALEGAASPCSSAAARSSAATRPGRTSGPAGPVERQQGEHVGARNHWRAMWRCGSDATSRAAIALAVGAVLDAGAERG
jgi:hypothetical protein